MILKAIFDPQNISVIYLCYKVWIRWTWYKLHQLNVKRCELFRKKLLNTKFEPWIVER